MIDRYTWRLDLFQVSPFLGCRSSEGDIGQRTCHCPCSCDMPVMLETKAKVSRKVRVTQRSDDEYESDTESKCTR